MLNRTVEQTEDVPVPRITRNNQGSVYRTQEREELTVNTPVPQSHEKKADVAQDRDVEETERRVRSRSHAAEYGEAE